MEHHALQDVGVGFVPVVAIPVTGADPVPTDTERWMVAASERIAELEDEKTLLRAELDGCIPELTRAVQENLERAVEAETHIRSLTQTMDEHPEGYAGPCECRTCLSY
jgi:hypothetical protein